MRAYCYLRRLVTGEGFERTGRLNTRGTQNLPVAARASRDMLKIAMCMCQRALCYSSQVMIWSMTTQINLKSPGPLHAFERGAMGHVKSDCRNIDYERHAEGILRVYYMDDIRNEVRVSGLSIARIHCRAHRRRDTLL